MIKKSAYKSEMIKFNYEKIRGKWWHYQIRVPCSIQVPVQVNGSVRQLFMSGRFSCLVGPGQGRRLQASKIEKSSYTSDNRCSLNCFLKILRDALTWIEFGMVHHSLSPLIWIEFSARSVLNLIKSVQGSLVHEFY